MATVNADDSLCSRQKCENLIRLGRGKPPSRATLANPPCLPPTKRSSSAKWTAIRSTATSRPPISCREGKLELLNTSGNVVAIDLKDIKVVYFVREFGDADSPSRKTFTTPSPHRGTLGPAQVQRQRSPRRHDAERPHPDHGRGLPDQSSGSALEHPAHFCAPHARSSP